MVNEAMLSRVLVPQRNVQRIHPEIKDPHATASEYERQLREFFQLVFLKSRVLILFCWALELMAIPLQFFRTQHWFMRKPNWLPLRGLRSYRRTESH
jgi:hypothetical protein